MLGNGPKTSEYGPEPNATEIESPVPARNSEPSKEIATVFRQEGASTAASAQKFTYNQHPIALKSHIEMGTADSDDDRMLYRRVESRVASASSICMWAYAGEI